MPGIKSQGYDKYLIFKYYLDIIVIIIYYNYLL